VHALTPPDPQLKGAWYPGGFNPRAYHVETRFQNAPFKWVNLRRYSMTRSRACSRYPRSSPSSPPRWGPGARCIPLTHSLKAPGFNP
jgi:hypothetical protein